MISPHNRLRPWQRRAVDLTGSALLVTGALWLLLHYGNPGELPQPLQAWTMRLHGAAAFAALFALGVLAAAHVPQGWRATAHGRGRGRPQRRWGIILCALAALLVLSSYLLYYFAPDNVRPALGGAHSAFGAAMAAALVAHRRAAQRHHVR